MVSSVVAEVVVAATLLYRAGRAHPLARDGGFKPAASLRRPSRRSGSRPTRARRSGRAQTSRRSPRRRSLPARARLYVVGARPVVLNDHLNPRYAKRVSALAPGATLRYEGAAASYTLASDGPDGKQGTARRT